MNKMTRTIANILSSAAIVGAIGGYVAAEWNNHEGTSVNPPVAVQPTTQPSSQPTAQTVSQPDTDTTPNLVPTCRVMNFGAEIPQFSITLANNSDTPVAVNSVTIAGYNSGAETGSTTVNIGEVITPGQNMAYWVNLPEGWYTDTSYPPTDNEADTYAAIPNSCQVLWYS